MFNITFFKLTEINKQSDMRTIKTESAHYLCICVTCQYNCEIYQNKFNTPVSQAHTAPLHLVTTLQNVSLIIGISLSSNPMVHSVQVPLLPYHLWANAAYGDLLKISTWFKDSQS